MIPLFVPADRPERYARAVASADAAILDLEDAVAPDRKAFARDAVAGALRLPNAYWIRINALGSDDGAEDLAMLEASPRPAAVVIPKAASAHDVQWLGRRLPGTQVYALVETIAGIVGLESIASVPGLCGIVFGAYDLCAELGARVTAEVLSPWRAHIVFTARRFGLDAIDTPFADLSDAAALAQDAGRAADFGFTGKLAIHPAQVPVIRAAFMPSAAEIARAQSIVAQAAGGVTVVNGSMIDAPLLALAHQTLERARKGST